MESSGMESVNGMEWNEWNGMNGVEWNRWSGMESSGVE